MSYKATETLSQGSKRGFFYTRKMERISILASITIIFLIYVAVLVSWVRAGQAGQAASSSYYDMLSKAFSRGQLNLVEAPSQSLLKLPDPYDPLQNKGLRVQDLSLYDGKYFLYWGPAPAVFIALTHLLISFPIPDVFVVWFSLCGLLAFNISIILWIKRRIFNDLPGWFTLMGIFLVGLSNPIPWILGRPVIYEAAIAGGQFFLMGGIYWCITGLDKPGLDIRRLFLAGLFWALAIATRMSLLIAIAFLVLFLTWLIGSKKLNLAPRHQGRLSLILVAAYLVPLTIMLGLLGLYNYFRFGSFWEFGQQYQLSVINMHLFFQNNLLTSLNFILPGFYNYVLMPLAGLSQRYPFIVLSKAGNGMHDFYPATSEYVLGVLWALPFLIFAFIPGAFTLINELHLKGSTVISALKKLVYNRESGQGWLPFLLTGTAFFGFLPMSLYYYSTMRYQADFTPALILLSLYGYGTALKACSDRPRTRQALVLAASCLGIISILSGIYLGINSSFLQFCIYPPSPLCSY
jgi:hypothetical protein